MSENCPYYITPGHRHIAVGSNHCLARKHPMCGLKDICPGGSAEKVSEPDASNSEADDNVSWVDAASEMGETVGAEPAEAEPEAAAETPAPQPISADERLEAALRRLRNENGFTLRTLGQAAGLSPVNISKWENGNHRPSPDSLLKLDRVFGSDLLERFGEGLREAGKAARVPRNKKSADIEPGPAMATPNPAANRAGTAPAPPPPVAAAPPIGGRDDFIREILYQAARAREDFNAIIHATLEAVKVSRKEKSDG